MRTVLALPAAALLLGCAAYAAVADDGDPAAGAPAAPPMSIELTDGVDTAAGGDKLGYTVTVHNQGGVPLKALRVEQKLPAGASGTDASEGGRTGAGGKVVWTADVKPNAKTTLTSRTRLGTPAAGALRAASTACAYLGNAKAPAVCASDLDTLGAGAGGPRGETVASSGTSSPGMLAGGVTAAGLAGLGLLVIRRRRRAAEG
ncbi:hypothetical protein ACIBL6_34200 [Streptomyces sp. NPDC050400]|uniref:hypothetical protein n=1 Tax=Streptomyces sp. NPDC050400 TaxID=3365610 RepID=UPI0037A67A7E